MLVQNPADPFGKREQEHVIAVCIRPIRHCQARAMTGHQPADAKQGERRPGCQKGKAVQPGIGQRFSHDQKKNRCDQRATAVPCNSTYLASRTKSLVTLPPLTSISAVMGELAGAALRW